jgi:hypothetical protein
MENESDSAIHFLDLLFIRKGTTLATKVCRKPTHTGQYLSFKSNHLPHVKNVQYRVFTIQLPPYTKNNKICLLELEACEVIFSSTVITKVPLTRLLIPTAAVIRIKRKSL